jgi:hypothetical protein
MKNKKWRLQVIDREEWASVLKKAKALAAEQ